MLIPKEIKIGGQVIKIVVTNDVPGDNNGLWDSRKATIFIYRDMPASEQEVSLLHEIIHALNNSIEHEKVEWLAQGIYQVIKDNGLVFDGRAAKK